MTDLDPQCSSLPHRGQLRGLEVGKPKSGECTVLFCECGESVDDDGKFCEDHGEGLADEDEVGVASYRL